MSVNLVESIPASAASPPALEFVAPVQDLLALELPGTSEEPMPADAPCNADCSDHGQCQLVRGATEWSEICACYPGWTGDTCAPWTTGPATCVRRPRHEPLCGHV